MSSLRLEVRGLNQLKLLNEFNRNGIIIKNLNQPSRKLMSFDIKLSDRRVAANLIEKQGFAYAIVAENSLKNTIKATLPRFGLLIGIAVMTVLSLIASKYLWKIEVSGNERVEELTVIRALNECGISVGKQKSFSTETVEQTLLSLEDISAVSAQVVGTTLKIDIVESSVVSPEKEVGDVVSLYDAEITRIIVNSGNAKVKIGDRVPRGAVLIEGTEYDTSGNPMMSVNAQGSVYGKVNFTYTETASLSSGYQRTGKVTKNTVLKLFGLEIGRHKKVEGLNETQKTLTQIGSFFPFYAETISYYELVEKPELSLDELTERIKSKAENDLIIRAGGSPISTNTNVAEVADKVYKITVHIEAEVSIGGKRND